MTPLQPAQAGFALTSRGLQPHGKGAYRIYFSISISPTAKGVYRIIFSISISSTARSVERIYSSSHKDRSCRAGLHPPSSADALCIIPPRAPRLRVHRTGSRGGAEARRWGAQFSQILLDGAAPVAASGCLARHGAPRQGSTYLRTAIMLNFHQPDGKK